MSTEGKASIRSVYGAVRECDRRMQLHANYAFWFGVILVLFAIVIIATSVVLLFWEVPNETIAYVVFPVLTLVAAFVAGVSRYHLRVMSRWDDYGLAFARLRIVLEESKLAPAVQATLIAAPFTTVGGPPELDVSALIDKIEELAKQRDG